MAAPTQEEVDRVIIAYKTAQETGEHLADIALEMRLNSGTDYTMVWTE